MTNLNDRYVRACPDDGGCHHACGEGSCFRVVYCSPLSGYGEEWSAEDVASNPPIALMPSMEASLLAHSDELGAP